MKCYYEQLGIPRDANEADIKTAYRKLALRWHPDKNPDAVDEAKERFQFLQQAYEVLSDPQERAWYDNHREQILRGKNSDYTENCLDVFEYFTSSCFRGYGDDDKGFYAVYREVFEKIAAEDAEFMDDEDEVSEIPTFGDSKSSYDDVVGPFYAYWQSYCTKKTYTWLCRYDVKEIRDRRVLREIEKDTKKLVQKARKERNEEVRNLVSFVRKRDKRVQAYRKLLEERAELNRKKQEQNRLEQIRKRQRELEEMRAQHKENNQHIDDDYEEQLKQLAQDYDDSSAEESLDDASDEEKDEEENEKDELETTEEDFYVDDLYCVACNKMFKNERAYDNHESSKKHREALERMKLEMQAEEEALQDNNDDEHESEEALDSETEDWVDEKTPIQSDNPVEAEENKEVDSDDPSAGEEIILGKKSKKSKKARRNAKLNKSQLPSDDDEHKEEVVADFLAQAKIADSDEEDWNNSGKKSARKTKNKKQNKKTAREVEEVKAAKDDTLVPQQKGEVKATQQKEPKVDKKLVAESSDEDDAFEEVKVIKKAASKSKSKGGESSSTSTSNHICVTCNANFPSKNKLFAHLNITKHGVYIPKPSNDTNKTSAEGSKSKKGKGKKK